MRKIISVLMIIPGLILLGAMGASGVPGGFSEVAVTEKAVVDAAEFAVEAEALLVAGENGSASTRIELLEILSAQQQVVSGVNYRLKLAVSQDGKEKMAEAVVWWQSWRKPDPYILTSWTWIEPGSQN